MKTNQFKVSLAAIAFSAFTFGAFAQTTPASTAKPTTAQTTSATAKQTPAAKPASTTPMSKEEFEKKYNEFKPKLDQLNTKAKENASKNPELATEVTKLNDMATAFKAKADKYDSTPKDQQAAYASSLKNDWTALQAQYNKAKSLDKAKPASK